MSGPPRLLIAVYNMELAWVTVAAFMIRMSLANGARILALPGAYSHYSVMSKLVEGLHARGHHATMFSPDMDWVKHERHYELLTVRGNFSIERFQAAMKSFQKGILEGKSMFEIGGYEEKIALINGISEAVVNSSEIKQLHEDQPFNLAIVDPFFMGGVLVAKKLGIPFIVMSAGAFDVVLHARHAYCPSPLSYVPISFLPLGYTDHMTFMQRTTNVIAYAVTNFMVDHFLNGGATIIKEKYLPDYNHLSLNDIFSEAEFWLHNLNPLMDYPRPSMPNIASMIAITAVPAKPLPKDLDRIVQGSGDAGIVLLSFGSMVADMPPRLVTIFADAFSKLRQKVIWRYNGKIKPEVSENVHLTPWMPQNDLLGCGKVRVFICHGGSNGVMEAVYHGVPMIVVPLFGDQFDVATRVVSKNMGLKVDVGTLTTENISQALDEVINNPRYKETAERLSAMTKESPLTGMQTAVYWIEYILKYGGKHLRPASHELNILQYFLIDVLAFILAVISLVICVVVLCCRLCFRICRRCARSRGPDKSGKKDD